MIKFSPPMVALANLAEIWIKDKSFTEQLQTVINDAIMENNAEMELLRFNAQGMKKITKILNTESEAQERYQKIGELFN